MTDKTTPTAEAQARDAVWAVVLETAAAIEQDAYKAEEYDDALDRLCALMKAEGAVKTLKSVWEGLRATHDGGCSYGAVPFGSVSCDCMYGLVRSRIKVLIAEAEAELAACGAAVTDAQV